MQHVHAHAHARTRTHLITCMGRARLGVRAKCLRARADAEAARVRCRRRCASRCTRCRSSCASSTRPSGGTRARTPPPPPARARAHRLLCRPRRPRGPRRPCRRRGYRRRKPPPSPLRRWSNSSARWRMLPAAPAAHTVTELKEAPPHPRLIPSSPPPHPLLALLGGVALATARPCPAGESRAARQPLPRRRRPAGGRAKPADGSTLVRESLALPPPAAQRAAASVLWRRQERPRAAARLPQQRRLVAVRPLFGHLIEIGRVLGNKPLLVGCV